MQSASSITRKRHSSEIIIKVLDKDGHVIQVHRQKMHSILGEVAYYFAVLLEGSSATSPTVVLLSSTNLTSPSTVTGYVLGLSFNGPFPQGVVLGYGTPTSPTTTASAMTSPYYSGSSTNQMIYGSPSISLSQSSTQSTISITQIIRNPTSSSETISELALIAAVIYTTSITSISPYVNPTSPYSMFAYDAISPSITVPSLGALQVTVNINFD
jgi:hypothetical protein